ncbi:PREDICTED: D-beta-hydroxybutyrate dehydrogenase, mitochondrial [Nicrophorus vespilloides]|uniref:D-beta-hydroxybutyrate dehydrogenase, mitochondrial n=1 Tax=Nicrophorus vespilloides TaxID=110193 RepID=A0ABM1NC33_NICVS|nr:PREDICTED: D-beta-hydroxybutyrate dehydrogenase, mitochondrial [Nicrophorus vespilloides]
MDEQTALVLALQLVALFSIAGALLLYLLCKIKPESGVESEESSPGAGKPVLVTSCDNAIGLQIALHLADRGYRVFAGLKDGAASGDSNDSASARVIRGWLKHRESLASISLQGTIVALPLDVNREDLLHESVDIIRAHLPAGKDGLWAVINTSGVMYRGRLEQQDVTHWDAILRTNVVGMLRVARTFQTLLRSSQGRIITLGNSEGEEAGLVAYTASRYAIQGASNALREELATSGVKVITLNPKGLSMDFMLTTPKLISKPDAEVSVDIFGHLEFQPIVLPPSALHVVNVAITCGNPKRNYTLLKKQLWRKPLHIFTA